MSDSIISNEKVCFRCGSTQNLHRHHIVSGRFREKSERFGLWIYLCASCHVLGNEAVHSARGIPYSNYLRKIAQERFEMTHSHEEWMKEFKRNWL